MGNVRVVLADDNAQIRSILRDRLGKDPGLTVVGEARNGFEALDQVELHLPDVLLLDMEMPGMNGLEVVRKLHDDLWPVQVLVLSAHSDPCYVEGVMEHGAAGYFLKEDDLRDVIDAINRAARGERSLVSKKLDRRLPV